MALRQIEVSIKSRSEIGSCMSCSQYNYEEIYEIRIGGVLLIRLCHSCWQELRRRVNNAG